MQVLELGDPSGYCVREAPPAPIHRVACRDHRRSRAERTGRRASPRRPGQSVLALTCSAHTFPVRIADPGPASQAMWGQLCYRGNHEPATVQLLVHGATYNHLYWDFPYGDGYYYYYSYYSYVDAATAVGYATFDIDRIGEGTSSHPPSSQLDLAAGSVALHDVVTALRSGRMDGNAFRHVIMVGHSVGSAETWLEAARYDDVDALIVTGALHAISPEISALQNDLYPAAYDPAFAAPAWTPDTSPPCPAPADTCTTTQRPRNPAVVAADEAHKDTVTVPELGDATSILSEPSAQQLACRLAAVPARRSHQAGGL
jgi:pimeloyl-ACP methyl ester carboxylesterase